MNIQVRASTTLFKGREISLDELNKIREELEDPNILYVWNTEQKIGLLLSPKGIGHHIFKEILEAKGLTITGGTRIFVDQAKQVAVKESTSLANMSGIWEQMEFFLVLKPDGTPLDYRYRAK